ncbi:MAG: DUF2225 domain-containing protein [Tissierellales bacterium]|jgi:uncharacterized protein (DUF2225 family)|nr:DUF2225 domain-containing protein [Tissierellales bacterium]
MEALYDKHFTCPVCKDEFTTKQVKKKHIKVLKRDSDLMVHYDAENPMVYSIVVCKKCGYSNLANKFEELNYKKKQLYQENLSKIWKEKDYTGERTVREGIETYKLMLFCENLVGAKHYEKAGTILKISWLYRILGEAEEEIKFQEMALALYQEAFETEDLSRGAVNEITVNYLIAELAFRLGELDLATKWMSSLISNRNLKNHPQIEKLAKEQWLKIKEKKQSDSGES